MNEVNWQEFKVRCSAISKVMSNSKDNPILTEKQAETLAKYRKKLDSGSTLTSAQYIEFASLEEKESNGKKIILSTGCVEYLMEEYAFRTGGRISVGKESLNILAMRKGNIVEAESMILLTRVDKIFYKTHSDDSGNKMRIHNDYLSGEIDYYAGESVQNAVRVVDNKASFDHPTFLKKIHTGLEPGQREQVQGYQDIMNIDDGYIANTLVDCPDEIMEEMRWAVTRKLHATTPESPEVLGVWPTWERSMKFDSIPINMRVHKIKVEPFTKFEQERVYDRVKVCREWLNNFHEQYQKMNL